MESVKTAKENKLIKKWLASVERRRSLFPQWDQSRESLRLLHSETGDLRLDKVGEHIVGGWWKETPPTDYEKESVRELMKLLGFSSWYYRWRSSKAVQSDVDLMDESSPPPPQEWVFEENHVRYQARREQGHAYGLFLDQRHNRRWMKKEAQGKRVLNLFCYTGGFSVCAAAGEASQVVSVDLSKRYLHWARDNFALNNCDPQSEAYEFRAMDSLDYLQYASRKGLQFDIIVCDPPSFSRNRKQVFRVDKDFPALIASCGAVLAPGGQVLFCTNYEKWGWSKWSSEIQKQTKGSGLESSFQPCYGDLDFEENPKNTNLKSFLLRKA